MCRTNRLPSSPKAQFEPDAHMVVYTIYDFVDAAFESVGIRRRISSSP